MWIGFYRLANPVILLINAICVKFRRIRANWLLGIEGPCSKWVLFIANMKVKWEETAVIFGFYAIMKCTKRNERFCIRSKYVLIIEKWKRVRCVYVCVFRFLALLALVVSLNRKSLCYIILGVCMVCVHRKDKYVGNVCIKWSSCSNFLSCTRYTAYAFVELLPMKPQFLHLFSSLVCVAILSMSGAFHFVKIGFWF